MNRRVIAMLGMVVLGHTMWFPRAGGQDDGKPRSSGLTSAIAQALLADARSRLPQGAPPPEIASVESATWGDTALGCLRPDEVAATRLVNGHRVLIHAGDEILDYHVADDGTFRLCLVGTRAPAPVDHPYPDPRIPPQDPPER